MVSKILRIMAFVLSLMMILSSAVACNSESDDNVGESGTQAETVGTIETKLPDIDWRGAEYLVLGEGGRPEYDTIFTNFEIIYILSKFNLIKQKNKGH